MKTLTSLSATFFDNLKLPATEKGDAESDKRCFAQKLEQFLNSGVKEDAFSVYFCFSEIFRLFGKGYDNTQKLLELLSDHEYHSGELLSKHRDHYSHSVYVFALGLAIYANDANYRKIFSSFYGCDDPDRAAYKFLYLWGACALFHDVGYPFQLAHEQIKNYATELWGKQESNPFVSFGNLAPFVALDTETQALLQKALDMKKAPASVDELLAYGLHLRMGYDEAEVIKRLRARVEVQPAFMDHGYFSALVLCKQLLAQKEYVIDTERLDILTAILLHNSFNKHEKITGLHPVALGEHPLAYLLILCDELQNWDRLAYGKISKRDPIAWDVSLDIKDDFVQAEYLFDGCTVVDENGKTRLNKSFTEIQDGVFVQKILSYISSPLTLEATVKEAPKKKKTYLYASDNSFINLCDFARAIHISYLDYCKDLDAVHINESFEKLSLEFKLSNIEQAKSYAYKLELVNCFYSSKDLDYPVVEDFREAPGGNDNLSFLSREEHVRWVQEKLAAGWKYGTDYQNTEERNRKRIHRLIVPFEALDQSERKKDELMVNNIIPLLKKFGNNIRIYSYRTGRKPDLEVAGTGHRFIADDKEELKRKIKSALLKYAEDYRVIVRTCFGYGADQLIAECAIELGLTVKAALPCDYEAFVALVENDCKKNNRPYTYEDELRLRHLLAQTVVCKTVTHPIHFYAGATEYIVKNSRKLIVLWDGEKTPLLDGEGKPINRGGTYDGICMAKEKMSDDDITYIHVTRAK